jgi:hypothetical protein
MADTLEQQIAKAKAKLALEMPDVAGIPIEPQGMLDKLAAQIKGAMIGGQVGAVTDPKTGAITYSQTALQGHSQPEIEDILAHELIHSRQAKANPQGILQTIGGLFGPHFSYGQDPAEMEAYQYEHDRAAREHRSPTPGQPDFYPGGNPDRETTGDIQLMKEVLKRN